MTKTGFPSPGLIPALQQMTSLTLGKSVSPLLLALTSAGDACGGVFLDAHSVAASLEMSEERVPRFAGYKQGLFLLSSFC